MFPTFRKMFSKKGDSKDTKGEPVKKPFLMSFKTREQAVFAKRLAMILRSGMPIMQGLHMLRTQKQSGSASYIYSHLSKHVESGNPLSSGLDHFRNIFGDFSINIIEVGERSGTLHENLDYLAEELKKKDALKKKVMGALVYPAVIVVATVGISLVLTVYIFPKITPIFQSFKTELPLTTRILIGISNFLIHDWLWLIIGLIVAGVWLWLMMRIKRVKTFIDYAILHLPLFGRLAQYYNLANIARTMGLLLKSNMGVVQAFEIVARSARNQAYKSGLEEIKQEVMKGQKISLQLMQRERLFPPLFAQMVLVSEQTGNLAGTFLYLSDMYEEEINDLTKNLTTLIEPVLMLVMGIVVGFIAVSIITPIYGITQQLTPH